jgi:hypothetical protein
MAQQRRRRLRQADVDSTALADGGAGDSAVATAWNP